MKDETPTPRFAPWLTVGIIWLLGAIPVGLWTGMFVHAVRASRFLGRWPKPDSPDPKALPIQLQSERIEVAVGAAVVALLIVLGVHFTRPYRWRVRFGAAIIGAIVLWFWWFVISRVDPGGVVKWYMD